MTKEEAIKLLYEVEDYTNEAQMWLEVGGVEFKPEEYPKVDAFFTKVLDLCAYCEACKDAELLSKLIVLPINSIWHLMPDDERPPRDEVGKWIMICKRVERVARENKEVNAPRNNRKNNRSPFDLGR